MCRVRFHVRIGNPLFVLSIRETGEGRGVCEERRGGRLEKPLPCGYVSRNCLREILSKARGDFGVRGNLPSISGWALLKGILVQTSIEQSLLSLYEGKYEKIR